MIKGITILRPVGNATEYERLSSFFSALGFASGSGWDEESSRGASFLAPLGNLEFVQGQMPSVASVLVEVIQLDAVRQAALAWLRAQGGEAAAQDSTPEELVAHAELMDHVRSILARLSKPQRALRERYYFADETLDQAAAAVGLSKSWGSRLHARAIDFIARELRNEDTGL